MTTESPLQAWSADFTRIVDRLKNPFAELRYLANLPQGAEEPVDRLKALAATWLTIAGPHSVTDVVAGIANRLGGNHGSELDVLAQRLRHLESEITRLIQQDPRGGLHAGLVPTAPPAVDGQGFLAAMQNDDGREVRFVTVGIPAGLKDALPPDALIGSVLVCGPTEWVEIIGTRVRPFYALQQALSLTQQQKAIEADRAERIRVEGEVMRLRRESQERMMMVPARAADVEALAEENRELRERLAGAARGK